MRASTMLLYGATGSSKTTQLGFAARYHFAKTGKRTRLLSADSTWDPIASDVRTLDNPDGIIEVVHLNQLKSPVPSLIKLAQGFWPRFDEKTKKFIFAPPTAETFQEYGLYAIEGLSAIADLVLQSLIREARAIGQDVVGKFTETIDLEGGKTEALTFAKAAMSHYDFTQKFVLLDLVPRFAALPVDRVIWTAHESKGIDEVTGMPTALGPGTVGKATVAHTAQKFADCLHLDRVVNGSKTEVRAYYQPHADDAAPRLVWPAKVSLPVEAFGELAKRFAGGYIPLTLTTGIDIYLEIKDRSTQPRIVAAPKAA